MASETKAAPAADYVIISGEAVIDDHEGTPTSRGSGARICVTAAQRNALKKQGVTFVTAEKYAADNVASVDAAGGDSEKVAALEVAVKAANDRAEAVERAAEAAAQEAVTAANAAATDHLAELATRDALIEKVRTVNPELIVAVEQEMTRELAAAEAEAGETDEDDDPETDQAAE